MLPVFECLMGGILGFKMRFLVDMQKMICCEIADCKVYVILSE